MEQKYSQEYTLNKVGLGSVKGFYSGKVLLITGTTGFLGKLVLEKILRVLSDVKKIYLLTRPKSGVSVMERVKREIFQSQAFDLVRNAVGGPDNFMRFIDSKIEALDGDISDPRIIFDEEKKREVIQNVNIIINNAASIDFNLRLDQALQINFYGGLGLLKLCLQCQQLEAFTHVSTAYVNSEKTGFIDEKIYEYGDEDPEEIAKRIMSMPSEKLLKETEQIIAPWPNTYTFTKNLCERALRKNRGNVPLMILRPAIIICSYQEPYPGWTDSMAAAGSLTLMVASGITKFLMGNDYNRADLIPVDQVANSIICGTAFQGRRNCLSIMHSASSHVNPVTWRKYSDWFLDYTKTSPFEFQFSNPNVQWVNKQATYDRKYYLNYELPVKMTTKVAELLGSQEMKKNAQKLQKVNKRVVVLEKLFRHFTFNDWCYESKKIFEVMDWMNPQERKIFNFNPRTIDWQVLSALNVYGIQKYMFRMDVTLPFSEHNRLISPLNFNYFQDSQHFFRKTAKIRSRDLSKIADRVLYSDRVQSELRNQTINQGSPQQQSVLYKQLFGESQQFLSSLSSQINPKTIQFIFFTFHTVFKRCYDQIIINDTELKQVKSLLQKPGQSVILIPTFKSYMDTVLIQYIHIVYGLDLAFLAGIKEWEGIALISKILTQCGGFFLDQSKVQNPLFQVLLEEFLAAMMKNKYIMGYQLERRRERSGKVVKPQQFIFEHVLEGFIRNQDQIQNVTLLPMTINYDKIYEGQQFPYELIGDESKREPVLKIVRNLIWTGEKYGRVHVKYGKPILLRDKISEYLNQQGVDERVFYSRSNIGITQDQAESMTQHKQAFADQLSKELVHCLSDNLVIMSTSMVASMLLVRRQGGVKEEDLLKKVNWLYNEIQARNGTMTMNVQPSQATIRNSIKYLDNFLDIRKDVFEPFVKVHNDYKNIQMLAYYRNNIIHLFINESYIATALIAFGDPNIQSQDISLKRLWEQTEFLTNILREEFVVRDQITNYEGFMNTLRFMEKRQFLQIFDNGSSGTEQIRITPQGKFAITFLSSLLLPFVESYWVTLSFIKLLPSKEKISYDILEQRVQTLAETMFNEGFIIYYESCSRESIGNAMGRFVQLEAVCQVEENSAFKIRTKEVKLFRSSNQEVAFFSSGERAQQELLKVLYERLTFFKPNQQFHSGVINYEEDVKRILSKNGKSGFTKDGGIGGNSTAAFTAKL